MNLQQTVSKILNKKVSSQESKDFAAEQYGTLCAFNRELYRKANPPKETRVYVLSSDVDFPFDMSGYEIENWLLYAEAHGRLTDEAEVFVTMCEEQGSVYSLYGFQRAFNIDDETSSSNDYIFITDLAN